MSFHSHSGWLWKRLSDGSVAVYPPGWRPGDEHVLSPSAWASIVASVSAGGEMDGRFYAAEALHVSSGPIRVEAAIDDSSYPPVTCSACGHEEECHVRGVCEVEMKDGLRCGCGAP